MWKWRLSLHYYCGVGDIMHGNSMVKVIKLLINAYFYTYGINYQCFSSIKLYYFFSPQHHLVGWFWYSQGWGGTVFMHGGTRWGWRAMGIHITPKQLCTTNPTLKIFGSWFDSKLYLLVPSLLESHYLACSWFLVPVTWSVSVPLYPVHHNSTASINIRPNHFWWECQII